MAEVRFKNNKFVCGEDAFKVTESGDRFSDKYVSMAHDNDDMETIIGRGSKVISYSEPLVLADEGYYALSASPTTSSTGYGKVIIGDGEGFSEFIWDRSGTVTLINNTANVSNDHNDDGYFCIDYENYGDDYGIYFINRLGSAKRVTFDVHYTEDPIAPTFQAFSIPSGVDNLDPELTINGETVEPTFRYKLGDADSTGLEAWEYGADLTLQAGTAPTYSNGSPGLGPNDDSCKFNGGGYYKNATAVNQVELEDFVIELVWKNEGSAAYFITSLATNGFAINTATTSITLYVNDADENLGVSSAVGSTPQNVWNHGIVYVNRNEASANGSWWFINGLASGSGLDCSAAEKTLLSTAFAIGASTAGAAPSSSTLAYCAMWKYTDWIQAGSTGKDEIAVIAKERFQRFCGIYPQIANGTYTPTVATRTYPAYLDKYEGDDNQKLYYVGAEWMRMCYRRDLYGRPVRGYLPETAATNLITYSEAFASWTKVQAGDVVTNDAVVCPDGRTAAASFATDSTAGVHNIYTSATLTVATYTFSCFVKPGDRDWVYLYSSTLSFSCYFDVANGIVGTASGCTGYVEGPFLNGFYRCCVVYTGAASICYHGITVADADTDNTITGDGSISLYIWGAQIELGGYMSSPIRTDAGVGVRPKDELQYVAGDNIGGVDVKEGVAIANVLLPTLASSASSGYLFSISDGGSVADVVASYAATTGYQEAITRETAGADGDASSNPVSIRDNEKHEIEIWWTDGRGNLTLLVDSVMVDYDASYDVPGGLDEMDIGQDESSALQFKGLIENFRVVVSVDPTETPV